MEQRNNKHRAEVIEIDPSGVAVKFSSGRIEFVLQRGLVQFAVGQRGWVDFLRAPGGGYEWVFSPASKSLTSVRLSEEAIRMRDGLSVALGVSKTAVIELALRTLARKNGMSAKG